MATCDKPDDGRTYWESEGGKARAAEAELVKKLRDVLVANVLPERWPSVLVAAFRAAKVRQQQSEAYAFAELLEEADMLRNITPMVEVRR